MNCLILQTLHVLPMPRCCCSSLNGRFLSPIFVASRMVASTSPTAPVFPGSGIGYPLDTATSFGSQPCLTRECDCLLSSCQCAVPAANPLAAFTLQSFPNSRAHTSSTITEWNALTMIAVARERECSYLRRVPMHSSRDVQDMLQHRSISRCQPFRHR